jgi:hypothetical protein
MTKICAQGFAIQQIDTGETMRIEVRYDHWIYTCTDSILVPHWSCYCVLDSHLHFLSLYLWCARSGDYAMHIYSKMPRVFPLIRELTSNNGDVRSGGYHACHEGRMPIPLHSSSLLLCLPPATYLFVVSTEFNYSALRHSILHLRVHVRTKTIPVVMATGWHNTGQPAPPGTCRTGCSGRSCVVESRAVEDLKNAKCLFKLQIAG